MGALPVERLVLGAASGPGNLVVLLGASTGRDGIGGVSVLASAGFGASGGPDALDQAKRPSVQVGDPYEEKRLIEACLELLDANLVVGIQDLGGAGLACATSETAARGRVGMEVDVSAVARRETEMEPWEVMTSESQERMLAIVTPDDWPAVSEVCARWEVRAAVIGRVTEPDDEDGRPVGRLRIKEREGGPLLADVPAASLADDGPRYAAPARAPGRSRGSPSRRTRTVGAARGLRPRPALAARRSVVGLPPVRPPAVLEHGGRSRWRRRPPPPGRARAPPVAPGSGPHHRREPPLVRHRPACRHGDGGGRGDGQPGLRRRPRGGDRELLQLRQSRARRGHVAALRGDRRDVRGLPRLRPPGHRGQRQPLQRERRGGHPPHAGHRWPRPGRAAGMPAPGDRVGGRADGGPPAPAVTARTRAPWGEPVGGRGARPSVGPPSPARPGGRIGGWSI